MDIRRCFTLPFHRREPLLERITFPHDMARCPHRAQNAIGKTVIAEIAKRPGDPPGYGGMITRQFP
ncbi:MAG: hypothetical protein P8Y48_13750 [Novosphingobium sp.]